MSAITLEDVEAETVDYANIEEAYRNFKKIIIQQATNGELPIDEMDLLLQYANAAKRTCRHLWKAQRRLLSVQESLQRNAEGNVTPSSLPEDSTLALLQESNALLAEPGNS